MKQTKCIYLLATNLVENEIEILVYDIKWEICIAG